jgi:RES domain
MTLALARCEGTLYRVGRRPDAWAWPDWAFAHEDGTFGNRYDDPLGEYRMLYAGTPRLGAFAETLARFRPDLELAATCAAIEGDARDGAFPALSPPGAVPIEWCDPRAIGSARHPGAFADVGRSESLAHLRAALAARALHYGFDDLDAGELRRRIPRAFTQEISRYVFVHGRDPAGRPLAGLRYESRLGDDLVNWAIFETEPPAACASEPIGPDDPDLRAVFARFGLSWLRGSA